MNKQSSATDFPAVLQAFFCLRLVQQKNASDRTIASYRDTFRLFLGFVAKRLGKQPTSVEFSDLDPSIVLAFLDYLENKRKNSARSRNARLAAIRSFMKYAGAREPDILTIAQRVLAIPMKRYKRRMMGFLSREEVETLLCAPDAGTWSGKRDHVMLATFYNTGARVSEIISLRVADVSFGASTHVRIQGKGRKERVIPLWKKTAAQIRKWLRHAHLDDQAPLFPNRDGEKMTRSGVESRLKDAVMRARQTCPSLRGRSVSPHTLRHTTAMHLLQSGVDLCVIALWLGHESPSTTHMYMEADLQMKERALAKVQQPATRALRYRATDKLLKFLEGL